MGPIRGVVRAESGRSPPMSTGFVCTDDGCRGVEAIEELLQNTTKQPVHCNDDVIITYLADRAVLPRLSELLADDSDATELALLPVVGVDGGGSPACTGIDAYSMFTTVIIKCVVLYL